MPSLHLGNLRILRKYLEEKSYILKLFLTLSFMVSNINSFPQFRFVIPFKPLYAEARHLSSHLSNSIQIKDDLILDKTPSVIIPSERAWQAEFHPLNNPLSFILKLEDEVQLKINFSQTF